MRRSSVKMRKFPRWLPLMRCTLYEFDYTFLHFRIVAEARVPGEVALTADPGHLPLRIAASLHLRGRCCGLQRQLAAHQREGLLVSQGLEGLRFRTHAGLQKAPHFVEKARGDHVLESPVEALVQSISRRIEAGFDDLEAL